MNKFIFIVLFSNFHGKTHPWIDKLKQNISIKFQKNLNFSLGAQGFIQENKQDYLNSYKYFNNIPWTIPHDSIKPINNILKFNGHYLGRLEIGQEYKLFFNDNHFISQLNFNINYNNNFYYKWFSGLLWNNFISFLWGKLRVLMGFGINFIILSYDDKNNQLTFFNKSYFYDQPRTNPLDYDTNEFIEISFFFGFNKYLLNNKWGRILLKFSFFISKEELIHWIGRFFLNNHSYGFYRHSCSQRPTTLGFSLNTLV